MRVFNLLFICTLIGLLAACGGETSSGTATGNGQGEPDTSGLTDSASGNNTPATALPSRHDCTISNEVMEGNQIWVREAHTLVAITADSTTFDENYGPSHRVLEVYNTESCDRIQREVLPVNVSPDFPYFLSEITYNKQSALVGIRGARTIYIYDVTQQRLLALPKPQYLSARLSEDAQSGNILRLEVWENYLIGFAEDEGTFAFNLNNPDTPVPVLPIAEFKSAENEFVPLFAFPSDEGKTQLTLPAYQPETDQFSINALYSTPQDLNTTVASNVRNNRYIVLRKNDANRTVVAVDMQNRRLVDLPANVATQPTQAVLQWVRQQ